MLYTCVLLYLITEDESIHIALDSDSDSCEDIESPLPTAKEILGVVCKLLHINIHRVKSILIASGSDSHSPKKEYDPPLPESEGACVKSREDTASCMTNPRGGMF